MIYLYFDPENLNVKPTPITSRAMWVLAVCSLYGSRFEINPVDVNGVQGDERAVAYAPNHINVAVAHSIGYWCRLGGMSVQNWGRGSLYLPRDYKWPY